MLFQTKSFKIAEINDIARSLLEAKGELNCIVLNGEMGAGKTTLAKAIGSQLGVKDTMASPTFSIVNEYKTIQGQPVYHFDFYRLKSEAEAFAMGIEEYLDSGKLCLIEWADKIPTLLPATYFKIELIPTDAHTRTIYYGKHR
ncbi:MAG: tRNA (adenosine(37)-N6)-threonylcarbamoyltransferase complex ATPase subunit type 1 TsaE [Flammeovirgaceae bacterium]